MLDVDDANSSRARCSDNHDLEIADAIDVTMQTIAALGRADAGRRAGEDEIAGRELEQSGQKFDLVRERPRSSAPDRRSGGVRR